MSDTKNIGVPSNQDQRVDASTCGEFDIRIAADGTWYHEGTPIGRKELVKLFSTVLRYEDGDYYLVTPVERGRITVDDAPFTAVEMRAEGEGRDRALGFRTNLDHWVTLDDQHPLRVAMNPDTGEPRPYILVRDRLEALILRPVFYELVALGVSQEVEGEERFGVWSKAAFFPLDGGPSAT